MLQFADLVDFSITSWYEKFKHICLKTEIIPIPVDLLKAMRTGDCDINVAAICSTDFTNQIKNVINTFDKLAFVRNNWRAPMDAKFISFGNSLQVTCVDDVILYLTASEAILSDFEDTNFQDYSIALRKYINIHPATEFRCLVVNNVLRGITPRDWPMYYEHFKTDAPNIIDVLSKFFEDHIQNKFSRSSYIFDVIMTHEDKVQLVDFGPLNNKTNLYAFSYKEIQTVMKKNEKQKVPPVFRYLESDIGIMAKGDALAKLASALNS